MVSVQPREKKQPPVSWDFSCARSSLASGQWRATAPDGKETRTMSIAQPTTVIPAQIWTQNRLSKPAESIAW
eukprot:scaffold35411_cov101-Isochrysis_galbana.AAC.2